MLRSAHGRATMADDADDRRQEAMLFEAEALMAKAEAMLLTRAERWTQLRLRRVAVDRAMAEYTAWREVVVADPELGEAQKLKVLSRYLRGPGDRRRRPGRRRRVTFRRG